MATKLPIKCSLPHHLKVGTSSSKVNTFLTDEYIVCNLQMLTASFRDIELLKVIGIEGQG